MGLVIRSLVLTFLLPLFATQSAVADANEASGRAHFDSGLALAERGAWEEAAAEFEQSLTTDDRPATRYNLVLAYEALHRPLDAARHALAFLAYPEEPHRAEASAGVKEVLERSASELVIVTTDSLPHAADLTVDGSAPLMDADRRIYLAPGLHLFEARIAGADSESFEMHVAAGQVVAWPRAYRRDEQPATASVLVTPPTAHSIVHAPLAALESLPPPSLPRWRTRLAWSVGLMGAALEVGAVGTYAALTRRAGDLRKDNPTEAGFLSDSDRYLRLQSVVAPLAFVGGSLMAAAIAVSPSVGRAGPRAAAIASLGIAAALLGTGLALVVAHPDQVGRTRVDEPTRQAGALFLGAALPFASYGITFYWPRHRGSDGRVAWFTGRGSR